MRRRIGTRVRVVRLTYFLGTVGSRRRGATGISPSRRIVCSPSPRGPVRAVGGRAGPIVAAVPCAISVVNVAPVNNRAAMPIAVPVAITPSATTIVDRGSYCDPNSECDYSGRHYGCSAIPRRHIRSTVDHRRVVLWDVYD